MSTAPGAGYDPLASVGGASPRPTPRIRMASPVTGPEEVEAVREVLESGILTNGPQTRRFEALMAQRHGTEHAVAFANGTVALAGMLLATGIGPGDEVIVPSLTFIGTATAVLHVGATPVFADIEAETINMDPDATEALITAQTKALMPIHYAGQPAQMDRFRDLADRRGLVLLEDAAQAHGAAFGGRPAGSWGDAAMFSFTPTKNITTGEGSIVTTDDEELANRLRLLRNHGMSAQYHHEIVGYNWRLSEMQSAIGCCQMERLDSILTAKRAKAEILGNLLASAPGLTVPAAPGDREHPYMIYTVQIEPDRRARVTDALDQAGIEWRLYFPPAHRQPVFAHLDDPKLPVTDAVAERIVSLPFHSRLTDAELAEVAQVVIAAL